MNNSETPPTGNLYHLLESIAYNAGTSWQQWVTWGLPLAAMVFIFTEVLARSEAKRKGNLVCLIQLLLGTVISLLAVSLINGLFLKTAGARTAVIISLVCLLVVAAGVMSPLGMLISGAKYVEALKAWLITSIVAIALVFGCNFGWQMMKTGGLKVLAMEGTVEHRASPLQRWSSLTETNIILPVGTCFKTGSEASAKLQLRPATMISVRPETVLAVRSSKGLPVVTLESGKMAGDVVPGQNEKFLIRSPAATSGILGTRFMVQSDIEQSTTTTVAEGFVAVAGLAANTDGVTVKEGMATLVKLGQPPEEPKPAAVTDLAEINKVFPKREGYIR